MTTVLFKEAVLEAIKAMSSHKQARLKKPGYVDCAVYVADLVTAVGVPRRELNVVLKQLVEDDLIRINKRIALKDSIDLLTEEQTARLRSEKQRRKELKELRAQIEFLLPALPHDVLDAPINAEVDAAYGPEGNRWDDNHFVVLRTSIYVEDDRLLEVLQKIAEIAKKA